MKQSTWAVTGGLLGAVVALVWQAPAAWLASAVQTLSHERVQLRQPQGTLWHGSAQWVLSSGAGGQEALALAQRLTWQLQPQADASLRLELSLPCCTHEPMRLWLRPTWTGVTLDLANGSSQWPLAWLGGLGAPWNTLGLEGQAQLQSHSLALQWQSGAWQLQGQAQLQLQSVSSRLSTLRPLGSYALDLQGGTAAHVQLRTLSGELHLNGQGEWRAQSLHFEGQAQAGSGSEAALANLLGVLGQRQGNTTVLRWG
jgi:general secretion pathway protein N